MKKHFAFILILAGVFINGCKDDEIIPPTFDYPEIFDCDHDIGQFDLLPSSLIYSPYNGKSHVYFNDSIGTVLVLDIVEHETNYYAGVLYKYDVISVGDTVRYCYREQDTRFNMSNELMNIKFSVSFKAKPHYAKPELGLQYDLFEIGYFEPNDLYPSMVFFDVIDWRTAPTGYFMNLNFNTYEIFGRTFTNVEKTYVYEPASVVYFNQTEGIVSFTDESGKTWRFDHFQ